MRDEIMREWSGLTGGRTEWKSNEKELLIEGDIYGVREKPGSREIPRNLQGRLHLRLLDISLRFNLTLSRLRCLHSF